MYYGLCHFGSWGPLGTFGAWGWVALALNVVLWVGLLAGLSLLAVWAMRRVRVQAATAAYATGQPTAKEILQDRYARGEITREQYEVLKRDIG